jgi:hypothetical protein
MHFKHAIVASMLAYAFIALAEERTTISGRNMLMATAAGAMTTAAGAAKAASFGNPDEPP